MPNKEKQFKNLRIASMFLFPVVTFIAFRAQDVFFFLPKEYPILSLQILIWALIFDYYNIALAVMAWFLDKKQIIVSTLIIGLLSFMLLKFFLIPHYGFTGLSTTILIVLAIMFAFIVFSFAKIGINIPVYKFGEKPIVASMGMMLALHYTDALRFAVVFAVAAASYVLILLIITFLEK